MDHLFHSRTFDVSRTQPFIDRLLPVRTVVINETEEQDWVPPELLRPLAVTALLWTQLVVQGKKLGALVALQVRPGRRFEAEQVELFEGIAQQLALSMEAVELYQQTRREAENASALARELDTANRAKSDFVAAIAHELRSPLSVITGYSSLLLDGAFGDLSSEQVEVVERVDRTSSTLAELVNALLDFSRLESGQLQIELRTVNLAEILKAVEDETRELRGRNSRVRFTFAPASESLPVHSDPLKLKVVLKNLIGNAIKFTEEGEVRIEAAPGDDGVDVRVSDTGIGIPAESLDLIFEPFRQADDRRAPGGFGLGLYIVRRLLELLGARIRVESSPGRGTAFTVSLPAAV